MNRKIIKLSILLVLLFAGYNMADAAFKISRPSTHNFGLVGHWTFDGKNVVNGVALDSSPNGNNANLINIATSTFYSIGKIGQGFNFDGTNDIASTTRINNNEITVAGWFNKTANDFGSNNSDNIFGAWYWNANTQLQEGFDLKPGYLVSQNCTGVAVGSGYLCSAFIVVTTNGTTKTQKTSSFNLSSISKNGTTTDEWFHMAGTYTQSDGNQRLYINGVLRDTDLHVAGNTVVPLATTTTGACYLKMNIGYSCVNNGYFNGKLDDVRLYNRALSDHEVKTLYNQGVSKFNKTPTNILTNGLVGHWTLDGSDTDWTTNTTADLSGGGNTGTMTSMSTSTSPAIGRIGQGFNFDGTDDYVTVPYNSSLELGNTGSVSLWVKPSVTSPSQTRNLITYGGTSYNNGYLLNQHDTILRVYWMFGTAAITVNNAFTANVWSHIVLTNNNGALTAYVNGIQAGSGTSSGTIVNNYATYIGGVPTGWIETGNIDDVRVYNRVLSDAEIKILYLMGR